MEHSRMLGPTDERPFSFLRYKNAKRGGGTITDRFPLHRGRAQLPSALSALLVLSDLQGRGFEGELLGVAFARFYASLAEAKEVPPPETVGVVIGGDMYAAPAADKRGASGDVTAAWCAFADRFRFVTGVLGNHDTECEIERDNARVLDGETVSFAGLTFGGVSFIPDVRAHKTGRTEEALWLQKLAAVCRPEVDLVVVHEGPEREHFRTEKILAALEGHARTRPRGLDLIQGHRHREVAREDFAHGLRTLNVDHRAVLLEAMD